MKLDVAIATWQPEGIQRVAAMNLPCVDGVNYIVSWQAHRNASVPESVSRREDIKVVRTDATGQSANRNNALDHCSADFILIADDDLTYTSHQLQSVIRTMETNPDVDFAAFKFIGNFKRYPSESVLLKYPLPKNYSVSGIEIALRRNSIGNLRFDELFGFGAPVWQAGEDEKLLFDAIKSGLTCRFFPIEITSHPHPSTGARPISSAGVAAASGRIIRLQYPLTALPRIFLKAWRQKRIGASFLFVLRHAIRGAYLTSGHH